MLTMILTFLLAFLPLQDSNPLAFEIRAAENLLFGRGEKTGKPYYDVIVTRQPTSGILIKLDYNRRNTKFSFDLHHRVALDPSFTQPAEITTIVQVLSGGTTSMGEFTISDMVRPGDTFEEPVIKVSQAEVDRYIAPVGRKTITLNTIPGSQSLSIVGRAVIVNRGTRTERRESPNARIAIVSNFKFEENVAGTILKID